MTTTKIKLTLPAGSDQATIDSAIQIAVKQLSGSSMVVNVPTTQRIATAQTKDVKAVADALCKIKKRTTLCKCAENDSTTEGRRIAQHNKMIADPAFAERLSSPANMIAFFGRFDMELWRAHGCDCERLEADTYFAALACQEFSIVVQTEIKPLWVRSDHERIGLRAAPDVETVVS